MKITTGIYRFKRINTLENPKLRPTSNKIRNAVFNILVNKYMMTSWSDKAHLLDAFSGSGIVSIEALSRNIKKATLIESDTLIFSNLKKNIKELENLRRGLREDIYSVFFISLFSFLYIHYNSIDSKNYALIYNNQVQHFNDKKIFLS